MDWDLYYIQTSKGHSAGTFLGRTKEEALLVYFRHKGFGSDLVWIEQSKIMYKDNDWRDFIGSPASYMITKLE